jgi:hypothetical protein
MIMMAIYLLISFKRVHQTDVIDGLLHVTDFILSPRTVGKEGEIMCNIKLGNLAFHQLRNAWNASINRWFNIFFHSRMIFCN